MVESVTTTNNAPRQYIHILEHFFDSIDSNTLFDATDPIYFRRLRDDLYDALYQLLFWLRPVLEVEKGLHWPYEGLTRRVSFFENAVAESPDHFIQRQACLFLARLPFPRQWQWLARAQDNFGSDPEIETFLRLEQRRIEKKLKKKRQNTFLLRHFCQILKKPRLPEEKGVLRIFSLPYLFVNPELLKALNRLYFLYVEPPWGIVFRQAWLRPFATLDDPTLFGLNGEEDAAFMRSQPGIRTTVLAHGDFLEDDESLKFDQEKRFDIVFNGTFDEMPRKRHAHMLELLRHPLLHRRKALFMGRGDPRNVEAFEQLIQSSGLSPRVTVRDNLLRQDVPHYLAQCKAGVQISLHENGGRSIYEFLRSDLPCVIATSMAGVNSAIINAQTGIAAPDRDLPRAISQALENRDKFRPRDWFLSHSGSTHSSRKLNDQLKAFFRDLGYSWQEDIVPLTSGGASRYVDRSHYVRLRPQFEELLKIFQNHARLPILPRFD
jgi:glycosyltransferase involved in cell wall biosynthesis